jgi:transcription elongation factor GreA
MRADEVQPACGEGRLPCTPAAIRQLREQAEHLQAAVGPAQAAAEGRGVRQDREACASVPDAELHLVATRLETVRRALEIVEVAEATDVVLIGSRVVTRDGSGLEEAYDVVAPGEGDPRKGRISAESPLGSALLRRRADEVVDVTTPAGTEQFTVVHVDETLHGDDPQRDGGAG